MRLLFGAFLCFFLVACSDKKKSESPDSTNTDSVAAELADSLSALPLRSYTINDSFRLQSTRRALSIKELKTLFLSINEVGNNDIQPIVFRIFQLDSIQRKLKQEDFDIGSLISADAYFLDTLMATMEYTLVSWTIEFKSFEACPYYEGSYCILSTFDQDKKIISSVLASEKTNGGDPPAWSNTYSESKVFSDGKIEKVLTDQYGEDQEGEETKRKYRYSIAASGFITAEGVEELSKSKIKQESN
ncbi:MAG: hypothetical protein MUF42_04745 [Cytophagaceae bacterium]|nr:hypothetical protein [Cytophagaceae bacterium]